MAGLTGTKAKTILREGKIGGKSITRKQKGFFGLIAGGGAPTRTKQLRALKRKSNG